MTTASNQPAGGAAPAGGQAAPTLDAVAAKVDALADKVEALVNVVGKAGPAAGPGSAGDAAPAAAADLQTQVQAEVAKIRDAEAAEAAAQGDKNWRASVDAFMARRPELPPVEPQRGVRGFLQRGLIGTPRQQRDQAAPPPVPPAAPPGGGGAR